jgi:hypothetical protein
MSQYQKFKNSRVPKARAFEGPNLSASGGTSTKHVNRYLCRTSEYKPPGSSVVGLAQNNQPSKVVWELDYGLNEDQFQKLSKRFPGIAFVQTGIGCHDHPIAHTSYRVVWENVMRKLKPGQKVADVSGNPDYNERFNRNQKGRTSPIVLDTFCKVLSTKDSIRAKTRWGPQVKDGVTRWEEMTLYDMYRNDESRQRFAQYDVFLMNHVIYYYTFEEVNKLLQLNPDSVLYATIHKLDGQKGSINCGEQEFEKDFVTGKVVQRNVETGETYSHADPAPWFSRFAYADEHGAMAWTVNKGCDDTYVLTVTSTDPRLVEESCWRDGKIHCKNQFGEEEVIVVTSPEVADPPPAYGVKVVELRAADLFGGSEGRVKKVPITYPELFETLKHHMLNKPRNIRTLQDLTAKAHREVGNNVIQGGSKPKVKISPEVLSMHIAAAWADGARLEDELFTFANSHNENIASWNRNISGNSIVVTKTNIGKQVLRFAALANGTYKSKDRVGMVLEHLEDLL